MKNGLLAVAIAAACMALGGCTGTARSETTIDPMGGVTQKFIFELSHEFIRDGVAAMSGGRMGIQSISAADIAGMAIDYTASNAAVVDGSGTAVLTLADGSGATIATQSFPFTVRDSLAFATDPVSVAAWVANYPNADSYTVDVNNVQTVDTGVGTASVTGTLYVDGAPYASSGGSWESSCTNDHGGGVYMPEMPVEQIVCN